MRRAIRTKTDFIMIDKIECLLSKSWSRAGRRLSDELSPRAAEDCLTSFLRGLMFKCLRSTRGLREDDCWLQVLDVDGVVRWDEWSVDLVWSGRLSGQWAAGQRVRREDYDQRSDQGARIK